MAALVLKRLVKERWDSASKHFTPPELGADEKTAIKRDLVPGLADPQTKVRIAIGVVIAGEADSIIWKICVRTPLALTHAHTCNHDLGKLCKSLFIAIMPCYPCGTLARCLYAKSQLGMVAF